MRRVVILGRGGAGKSTLARQLSEVTGLPVTELDPLFWQPGLLAPDPARWAARQRELVRRSAWILDGDFGPHDDVLGARLRAADTIIMLDLTLWRCAWRTIRRGRERADYWRWLCAYRRRYLPTVMQAITTNAPEAKLYVLRNPGMIRCFVTELRQTAGLDTTARHN